MKRQRPIRLRRDLILAQRPRDLHAGKSQRRGAKLIGEPHPQLAPRQGQPHDLPHGCVHKPRRRRQVPWLRQLRRRHPRPHPVFYCDHIDTCFYSIERLYLRQ